MEGWVLHHNGGERMRVQDMDKGFQEVPREFKERQLGRISE